jgi:phosphotriesterase-related protein
VTGPVPAEDLGITLPHEHLIVDTSTWVASGPDADLSAIQRKKLHQAVSSENLWWVSTYGRQWEWNCLDNRRLDDVDTAIEEVTRFVAEGGATIVDVTPMSSGLGRDPVVLRRIANQTGLTVVAGTGHYVRAEHPPRVESQSAEEIAAEMVEEVDSGIGETTIRAGVIGEIGASHPFDEHPNEQKVFRAAALAQRQTGAPITVHPPVMHQEGHEVLDVLEDAGADLENVILGHLDGALETTDVSDYYDSIAKRGVYLEFDTFGRIGYVAAADQCFPLDESRIRELRRLMDAGHGEQLLISHDICKKNQLTTYAGFGYDYILRDIVPRMRRRGFTEDELQTVLERNPASALALE